MNPRGQALIESIPIFMVLFAVLVAMVVFTQWFLIHQKLLIATREGAMLYSSGRFTSAEVRSRVRRYLNSGSLALDNNQLKIEVGRWKGNAQEAWLMQLDEVRITYRPSSWLQKFFKEPLEETCVIKHAPHYGAPLQTRYGPKVPW